MTEQEFRERLKRAARNDGLSPERQMQVLARMKGDEHKVRNWHKVKYILVIALLLATGVTGAVASNNVIVNWKGETVTPPPMQTAPPYMSGLYENLKEPEKGQIITLENIYEIEGTLGIGSQVDRTDAYASSVAEMQAWVESEIDEFLPWPVKLPKGYDQLEEGRVHYAVDAYGEFKLIRQEVTEDGEFVRSYFELPDDHLYMDRYSLRLLNAKEQELSIDVFLSDMDKEDRENRFVADDVSSTTQLDVDGFDTAIAIKSPEKTTVALLQEYNFYIRYKEVWGYPDGVKRENIRNYDCLVIEITGQGSPADLLAIFGLEAQ